jgi:hypothetical protein
MDLTLFIHAILKEFQHSAFYAIINRVRSHKGMNKAYLIDQQIRNTHAHTHTHTLLEEWK